MFQPRYPGLPSISMSDVSHVFFGNSFVAGKDDLKKVNTFDKKMRGLRGFEGFGGLHSNNPQKGGF